MSLGPLDVLLGEVSVQVLCPFFNWVVCLPGVESCEFFIYFADQTLVWSIIGKYIFPYGWFPFHFADPKNPDTPIQKNLCTSVFIAAQFTIAKWWKQPKCASVNEWIKNHGIFTQWNTMQQKEGAPTLHDSMDGTGEHYGKWHKPSGERQIPYDLTYKWNLINKTNKQNITRDTEIKTNLTVPRGEVGGDNGGKRRKGFQGHL